MSQSIFWMEVESAAILEDWPGRDNRYTSIICEASVANASSITPVTVSRRSTHIILNCNLEYQEVEEIERSLLRSSAIIQDLLALRSADGQRDRRHRRPEPTSETSSLYSFLLVLLDDGHRNEN